MHFPTVQRKVRESQVTGRFYDSDKGRAEQRTFYIPGWYKSKTDKRLISNVRRLCIVSPSMTLVEITKLHSCFCIYRMRLCDFMAYADVEHDVEDRKENKSKNERKKKS